MNITISDLATIPDSRDNGDANDGLRIRDRDVAPQPRPWDWETTNRFQTTDVPFTGREEILVQRPDISEALEAAGSVMCGNPLEVLKDKLALLDDGKGNSINIKKSELESLPTEYCQNLYRQIVKLSGGPVIWGFLKPIMQGRIFILKKWSKGVTSIDYFKKSKSSIKELESILKSDLFKDLLLKFFNQKDTSDNAKFLSMFNMTHLLDDLGDSQALSKLVILASNITECFNSNRFHGYDSEEEIVKATRKFGENGQFLAMIPSLQSLIPHIQYKIRMDVDSVQYTMHKKDVYWRPKARDNFATDLLYQHGFIQIQDMIDRAIIKLHSNESVSESLPQVLSQQFPYPCYNRDEFGYYLKGMLPVIMTMAWLFLVAFLIREKILERELRLEQIMRVMGLHTGLSFLSWFLLNLLIMVVIIIVMVIMVKVGNILPYSDWTVLFIFLLDFSFAVLMFCYCISVFFKTAVIGALVGLILYLLFYLPFVIMLALEASLFLSSKLCTSLLMSSAFSFGCLYLARYEELGLGIQWQNIWNSPLPNDQMNFAYALIMMAVDGIIYGVIGWYISNVYPAQVGVSSKKWYFFILPSYWGYTNNQQYVFKDSVIPLSVDGEEYDNDRELDDYTGSSVGVVVSKLRVIFNEGKKSQKIAVKNLSLDLYQNQITTLLGQNGAGKTTTMYVYCDAFSQIQAYLTELRLYSSCFLSSNVLTGQQLPTGGQAFISGFNVISEFSKAQRRIGYCPQYNILFDNLTIREHLEFYGRLKGLMSKANLQADINKMISIMGLNRLQDERVTILSGGMKRRLCVAIAFVGGSTTIILDEPTSGVDPVARRSIWDLILKYKQGRTILLTTHYMDEADILSDRVAIMHQGSLLCCGISMNLKSKYGSGYLLSVESTQAPISDEKISKSPTSGDFNSYGNFNIEEILIFLQKCVPQVQLTEAYNNHSKFTIPVCDSSGNKISLEKLFVELDKNCENLGIITYNLSCTTLEEVFLKVCCKADSGISISSATPSPKGSISSRSSEADNNMGIDTLTDVSELINEDPWMTGSTYRFGGTRQVTGMMLNFHQFCALIYKRFWHNIRDWRVLFCGIFLPCIFIAAAMGFSLIQPKSGNNQSLMLTPSMYGPGANSFISNSDSENNNAKGFLEYIYDVPGVGTSCMNPRISRSTCVRANQGFSSSYVGSSFEGSKERTCKCVKDFPIQKCEGENLGFVPLRYTANTTDNIYDITGHDINEYLILTYKDFLENRLVFMEVGLQKIWNRSKFGTTHMDIIQLPAYFNSLSNAFLRSVVDNNKHQYGITTYNHPIHVTSDQLIRETITQRVAEIGISLVFIIGFCFIPSCFVLYLNIEYALEILEKAFLVFPHYALGSGLLKISRNQIKTEIYRKFGHEAYENPFDFLFENFLTMLIQGIIFFIINMLIESPIISCLNRSRNKDSGMPIFDPEDADVQAERKRVNSSAESDSDLLQIINLTKVYRGVLGKNIAVDKLCVGVKKGECFGLLGVNGAGKTTTFRMLTGDLAPTWGQSLVKNQTISKVISKGNRLIGYCPQADALDDNLTCKEVLTIYAKLRGVPSQDIDMAVHRAMTKYSLRYFANRLTKTFSGGTKRKLCAAVSTLGNPELILMDEPTSGMDPKTRRLVWNNILSLIKDQKSVVLTSHSMEECDVLCSRLAIMVNGRLKCIGTPQYLKNKFSDGFTVTLRLAHHSADLGNVIRFFHQTFPYSSLKAHNNNVVEFNIPSEKASLGLIFHYMENESERLNILDFSVTQTSLDQVFVNFSRNQSDGIFDEDEAPLDFGVVEESGSGHSNAAYNKIYGLPSPVDTRIILDKSPNMYYGDESNTDDFSVTKL
ncbi:ATP-binding cassette sub-family A member 1 [Nymphon striatum]|nr:ATP-binding cassette sub-family A member 1 [Nymphon striatum]